MSNTLPGVSVSLTSVSTALNPQDVTQVPMVVGPASLGTVNQPIRLDNQDDVRTKIGYGPGPELAAECLAAAGGPVFFTRSQITTASVTSTVVKTPANPVGVAIPLPGEIRLAGADKDGNVLFRALVPGVTLTVAVGMSAGFSHSGNDVTLTVTNTTTGTQVAALSLTGVSALIAAPVALGTGASVCGQTLAKTGFDKGSLSVGALAQNVRFKTVIAGSSNANLDASASGSDVTFTLGTDADGQIDPTKNTAALLVSKIAGAPAVAALISASAVGDGTGLVGQQAVFQSLQFGSSGALVLSGTANDRYNLQIQIVRGAAVGGSPAPTLRWAVDELAGTSLTPNWTGETLIPGSGVVALRTSVLDTGLTATLTGTFDAQDAFSATTTAPECGATDLLAGLQAAIDQYATVGPWGFACGPDPVTKATLALIDAKIQTSFGRDFVQSMWGLRDIAAGVPGETESQWENALIADLQGLVTPHGLGSVCAGPFLHDSSYSTAQYRRQAVFAAAARRASIPVHEDLGRVRTGPLSRVLWLYHNEDSSPALAFQRVITLRTYPGKPGAYYITSSPTLADPSDIGYSLVEWVSVACGLARNVYAAAFDVVQDDLEVSAIADKAQGNVAGSLSLLAATSVSAPLNRIANAFLFNAKSDGNPSASAFPIGEEPVTVRRTNDFAQDRTVYCDTGFYVRGIAQYVKIPVAVKVP